MIPDGKPGERRYSKWAGNPKGVREHTLRCVETVYDAGRFLTQQCSRKRGFGPGGELCKQHAKVLERLNEIRRT